MVDHHLDRVLEGLKDTANLAAEFNIQGTDDDFELFSKMAFDLCKTDLEAKARAIALEAAAREETTEEFERALEANQVNITKSTVTSSSRYKAVISALNTAKTNISNCDNANNISGNVSASAAQIELDNDDDDASGSGASNQLDIPISDIDPITKQPLQNPCRNRHCGHVYGMDSAVEALQTNARMRCPIMGCINKRPVLIADLVLDKELARKLYVQRAQKRH